MKDVTVKFYGIIVLVMIFLALTALSLNAQENEQLEHITKEQNKILERVREGVLPGDKVIEALRAILDNSPIYSDADRQPHLIHGLFVHTDLQIENIKAWNERFGWGFVDEDFVKLGSPPAWPDSKLIVVVLVPYLDTVYETFVALSDCIKIWNKHDWRWRGLRFNPDQAQIQFRLIYSESDGGCVAWGGELPESSELRLLEGVYHKRGLRWEIIDLGAKLDENSIKTINPKDFPNAGVLACAAHHPRWVRSMNNTTIPGALVLGYQVRLSWEIPHKPANKFAPYIYWDSSDDGDSYRNEGTPVFVRH